MISKDSRFLGHAFYWTGRVLHALGRYDAAATWYERASARIPGHGAAQLQCSEALIALDRVEPALRQRAWWAVAAMKRRDFREAARRWAAVRSWIQTIRNPDAARLLEWEEREAGRAEHLAALADAIGRYRSDTERIRRIASLLGIADGSARDFRSREITEGDRAVFAQVHTPRQRSHHAAIPGIFEKASADELDGPSLARERQLFDAVDHERLSAPAILGRYSGCGFTSHFYELVRGVAPDRASSLPWGARNWDELRSIIVLRQMAAPITEDLAAEFDFAREYPLLGPDPVAHGLPAALHDQLGTLLDDCARVIRSLPLGVVHSELYDVNTLVSADGRVFVIDWEMWKVLPYGAAYWPSRTEYDAGRLDHAWALERWGPPGVTQEAVLLAGAVTLVQEDLARGRTHLIEERLDLARRMLRS